MEVVHCCVCLFVCEYLFLFLLKDLFFVLNIPLIKTSNVHGNQRAVLNEAENLGELV